MRYISSEKFIHSLSMFIEKDKSMNTNVKRAITSKINYEKEKKAYSSKKDKIIYNLNLHQSYYLGFSSDQLMQAQTEYHNGVNKFKNELTSLKENIKKLQKSLKYSKKNLSEKELIEFKEIITIKKNQDKEQYHIVTGTLKSFSGDLISIINLWFSDNQNTDIHRLYRHNDYYINQPFEEKFYKNNNLHTVNKFNSLEKIYYYGKYNVRNTLSCHPTKLSSMPLRELMELLNFIFLYSYKVEDEEIEKIIKKEKETKKVECYGVRKFINMNSRIKEIKDKYEIIKSNDINYNLIVIN